MKKLVAIILSLVFMASSVGTYCFAIIPGEDTAQPTTSLTFGNLQETFFGIFG